MLRNAQLAYAPEINRTGAAIGAMHHIIFIQQQLGKVGTVLTGDASNECNFFMIIQTKNLFLDCRWPRLFTAIFIIKANDVIFSGIGARLHLNQDQDLGTNIL